MTDAHLDHLAVIYRLNPRLRNAGVSFAAFAADPAQALVGTFTVARALCDAAHGDFRPLLPAQRFAAARIAAADRLQAIHVQARAELALDRQGYQVRCGIWVLPLRHHRWPVSHADFERRV